MGIGKGVRVCLDIAAKIPIFRREGLTLGSESPPKEILYPYPYTLT